MKKIKIGMKFRNLVPETNKRFTLYFDNNPEKSYCNISWDTIANKTIVKMTDKHISLSNFMFASNILISDLEEDVLPERWFCRAFDRESNAILTKWLNTFIKVAVDDNFNGYDYYCSDGTYSYNLQSSTKNSPSRGYTEITFEQFKKYVLMEKKIIGYKFKPGCEIFTEAAVAIEGNKIIGTSIRTEGIPIDRQSAIDKLREAKVLDVWFDAVYEAEWKVGDWAVPLSGSENEGRSRNVGEAYKVAIVNKDSVRLATRAGLTDGNGCISFKNVRHANTDEVEATKLFKIGEHTVTLADDLVKVGCTYYSKDNLETARKVLNIPNVKYLETDDGNEISRDIIDRLLSLL